MFKDQQRELRRLEEALEEDRQPPEPELPEEFDPPEEWSEREDLPTRPLPELRSTDRLDVDPEELSRELWEPPRQRIPVGLLGFAAGALLMAAILGWIVLKERGLLP